MNEVNRIINESGISKVNVAKFLGVSRQMLYNYLALSSTDELPKDKQNKLLLLLGVENESELKSIKVNEKYIATLESKINDGMVDDIKEQMKSQIPLGTFGSVQDIANAVVFLASDEAKYITGQTLHVDGGMAM